MGTIPLGCQRFPESAQYDPEEIEKQANFQWDRTCGSKRYTPVPRGKPATMGAWLGHGETKMNCTTLVADFPNYNSSTLMPLTANRNYCTVLGLGFPTH